MIANRVHAPPARGMAAYCRYFRYPDIATTPLSVTCFRCLAKMASDPVPPGWVR